jgi:toxin CptA
MAILSVHLKSSLRLTIILSLAHLVAAGLLWPLALPFSIKVTVIVVLIISLIYYLRRDALLTAKDAVVVFELSDDMQCTLTKRSGESIACTILGSTFVAPYLTVLNLKSAGKLFMRSVVIMPDGIDAEEFRCLRVWLRWKWKEVN